MRLSPLAAFSVGLAALGLALTGCAPAPSPASAETHAATAEPTPEPAVKPIVIGPAEMPPVAFAGDCARALSTDDIAEVIGTAMTPAETEHADHLDNMGGLHCTWTAPDGGSVRLEVVPRAGLDGAVFPAEFEESFFGACSYDGSCRWQDGDARAWLALEFRGPEVRREVTDAWGEALSGRVLENYAAAADESWTRDRTGWFPALDCTHLAQSVGVQSDSSLEGIRFGWDVDLPPATYALALGASHRSQCWLADPAASTAVSLQIEPGLGAELPENVSPVELGVPGITAHSYVDERGPRYILTDGVNRIEMWGDVDHFAATVAAAAASGFE